MEDTNDPRRPNHLNKVTTKCVGTIIKIHKISTMVNISNECVCNILNPFGHEKAIGMMGAAFAPS